jgi:hypothetical protein
MYGYLWRQLPGPWPVRTFLALALLAAVVVGLFAIVFPAVEPKLPWSHDTVSTNQPSGDYTPTTPAAPSTSTLPGD